MILKSRLEYYFYVIAIYLFVFQDPLKQTVEFVKYWDELFVVLFFVYLILYIASNKGVFKIERNYMFLVAYLLLFILCGLYGNWKWRYQPWNMVCIDAFAYMKFVTSIIFGCCLFKRVDLNIFIKKLSFHINLITVLFTIAVFLDFIYKMFPTGQRYGVRYFKVFYSHPTMLSAACVIVLMWATMAYRLYGKCKFCIILLLLFMLLTLRTKSIGSVIVYITLFYYILIKYKRIKVKTIACLLIVLIIIAWNQIVVYYIENQNEIARAQLTLKSIAIAKDYFPLGTGFATYGSHASRNPYSIVYNMYGLNIVYGLSENMDRFISDTFWPIILGQTGVLGCFLQVLFGQNCRTFLDIVACPFWTMLQRSLDSHLTDELIPLQTYIQLLF